MCNSDCYILKTIMIHTNHIILFGYLFVCFGGGGGYANFCCCCYGRKLDWTGHVAMMEETRNAYKILAGKPLGEHPHG
jgi:hypothetical protein